MNYSKILRSLNKKELLREYTIWKLQTDVCFGTSDLIMIEMLENELDRRNITPMCQYI